MTICNMSIEGGARVGYVNPDETTFAYLRGRPFAPQGDALRARRGVVAHRWRRIPDAAYDDVVEIDAAAIEPTVTWGINPGQSVAVDERAAGERRPRGAGVHGLPAGQRVKGTQIDVAFVGSCTNARLSDLREAARVVRGHHVAPHVKALVVPGSQAVRAAAEREGLDRVFLDAGFEWRGAGCSMCLAMNPDRLEGREICASSSNRNFKGRQGSPTGRTLLMSPAMVAAAAVAGEVVDVREFAGAEVRRWPLSAFARSAAPRIPLPRRRHRHRSHHSGAVPKSITFEGLEDHLFEDDRATAGAEPSRVESSLRRRAQSCWSTRTSAAARHASTRRRPSCRRGIRAVVGQSFSEIFFGNSVALGHAVSDGVARHAAGADVALVERDPATELIVDLESMTRHRRRPRRSRSRLPAAARDAFIDGSWDGNRACCSRISTRSDAVAARLPYVSQSW